MQITGKFTRNKDISARLNREVEQRKFVYLHAVCDRAYNAVPVIYSCFCATGTAYWESWFSLAFNW